MRGMFLMEGCLKLCRLLFEKLQKQGVHVLDELRLFQRSIFDVEVMFEWTELTSLQTETLTWERNHALVSISICSNVRL